MSNKRIYLDYASITPIDDSVKQEILKFSGAEYANPSSLYREGVNAKVALKDARIRVAQFIHAQHDEIYFTSGGTEANNLAIFGVIEDLRSKGLQYDEMHIITSVIEHSSVRECFNRLNSLGVKTDFISVNNRGVVNLDELADKIQPNTVLVSIMAVNNEIGTIQPLFEISKIIRRTRKTFKENSKFNFQSIVEYPLLHTDASQAVSLHELNVEKLGFDLLTIDGSKMYGPRGVGALYIKRNTPIAPIIYGGGQESGLRSGTESLPGVCGLAKAYDLILQERSGEFEKIKKLRQKFINGLNTIYEAKISRDPKIKKFTVNGYAEDTEEQSPHILSTSLPGIDNEFLLLRLDANGISCSTKSSCLRDEDESYVLKSIGANSANTLRFSFGRWTTDSEIQQTLTILTGLLT